MKTVILKWNPAFSSYSMEQYLAEMREAREGYFNFNWSVWNHDQIHEGDRFYWVKLGYGQTGIVGMGTISSDPYSGEDWSGKGRQTFYVDLEPQLLLNPDGLPILTAFQLDKELPSFDWHKGHSGVVLSDEEAQKLNQLWDEFVQSHAEAFDKANQNDNNVLIYKE